MKILLITITLITITLINIKAQTVLDIDGNTYNTITIGTQTWMKENLRVTHYNNGDSIPYITNNTAWAALSTDAYCHYNNNANHTSTYGLLYNFFTVVDTRKLCPTDWHIPTDAEWTILSNFLGGATIAGGKMKETGNVHWSSPNVGATNSSGFTGLPAGLRSSTDGTFGYQTEGGGFWSNTELNTNEVWDRFLVYGDTQLDRFNQNKKTGYSVRCIKDVSQNINEIDSKSLKIYPNPVNDKIIFKIPKNTEYEIVIYNLLGEILIKKNIDKKSNEIDVYLLKHGIYIIEASNLTGKQNYKFFKQ